MSETIQYPVFDFLTLSQSKLCLCQVPIPKKELNMQGHTSLYFTGVHDLYFI